MTATRTLSDVDCDLRAACDRLRRSEAQWDFAAARESDAEIDRLLAERFEIVGRQQ